MCTSRHGYIYSTLNSPWGVEDFTILIFRLNKLIIDSLESQNPVEMYTIVTSSDGSLFSCFIAQSSGFPVYMTQCCFDVDPPSTPLAQHYNYIGSACRVRMWTGG